MPRRLAPLFFTAVLATLLSACLFTKPIEKPTAQVRGVSVGAISFSGLEGAIDLDIQNPNSFGVPLSEVEWELSIGGADAVSGRIELSQTIPARGVAPVTASLRIDAFAAVAVGSELSRGARTYRLAARLHFKTPLGHVAVDIEHTGDLVEAGSMIGRLY